MPEWQSLDVVGARSAQRKATSDELCITDW